jgi:hypothetical protein
MWTTGLDTAGSILTVASGDAAGTGARARAHKVTVKAIDPRVKPDLLFRMMQPP